MSWLKRAPSNVDADAIIRKAEDTLRKVEEQQPHVNKLTTYLINRKDRNGFGDDFEFTFKTKEA